MKSFTNICFDEELEGLSERVCLLEAKIYDVDLKWKTIMMGAGRSPLVILCWNKCKCYSQVLTDRSSMTTPGWGRCSKKWILS